MAQSVFDGPVNFRGGLVTFEEVGLPVTCVGDRQASASDPITAEKLEHQYALTVSQANGSASVTDRRVIHVGHGTAGEVLMVRAGVKTACIGGATLTIDVLKNGTTILSSTFAINSTHAAYELVEGTVSVAAFAAEDVFEVSVTAATGGGTQGQGLFVQLVVREDAE